MARRSVDDQERAVARRREREAGRPRLSYLGVVRNAVLPKTTIDVAALMEASGDYHFRRDFREMLRRSIEKLLSDLPSPDDRLRAMADVAKIVPRVFQGVVVEDWRTAMVSWSLCVLRLAEEGLVRADEQAVLVAMMIHEEAREDGEVWRVRDWGQVKAAAGRLMDNLQAAEAWQLPAPRLFAPPNGAPRPL